jgi:threonine dehydrogenase-like Zn-dependent dehydrogenase
LNSGRLDIKPVLTHTFPLEKIDDAMALLNAKEIKAGKIVLKP